jgi:hypothetical protein
MQINNFVKSYVIYSIRDNKTQNIYIGSTSNLSNRISNHISSYKAGNSLCSSVKVLENDNYTVDVLLSGLDKNEAKHSELNFINAYGSKAVNVNKPIIISIDEYKLLYSKKYYRDKKKVAVFDSV